MVLSTIIKHVPSWKSFSNQASPIKTYQKETYLTQIAAISKLNQNLIPTSVTFRYQVVQMVFNNIPDVVSIITVAAVAATQFLPQIRAIIKEKIPIRSGKLQDQIFQNSFIEVKFNGYSVDVRFVCLVPNDRPLIIRNPAHNGEIGWAYPYRVIHPDLVKPIVVRATTKGAYFLLQDPDAVSNYYTEINQEATILIHIAMMNALSMLNIHLELQLQFSNFIRNTYIGHVRYNQATLELYNGQAAGRKPQDLIIQITPKGQQEYEMQVTDLTLGLSTTQTFFR